MSTKPLIGVITNPNSKRNRKRPERVHRLRQIVGDVGVVRQTHHVDEIALVVEEFLDDGLAYWVADGGDGAFHWLINIADQVIARRGRGEVFAAILPTNSGTINYLGRKCGVVGRAEGLLEALVDIVRSGRQPEIVEIDSLRVVGQLGEQSEQPGQPFDKLGFAVALVGVGQQFFDKFYGRGRKSALGIVEEVARITGSGFTNLPGLRHIPLPTEVRAYAQTVFEPVRLDVSVDGKPLPMQWYSAINIGSIDIDLAGVFRIFARAGERGVLHAMAGKPNFAEVVANLPLLAAGKELVIRDFFEGPVKRLEVVAHLPYGIDPVIDGELFYGLGEASVSLGPSVRVLSVQARDMR